MTSSWHRKPCSHPPNSCIGSPKAAGTRCRVAVRKFFFQDKLSETLGRQPELDMRAGRCRKFPKPEGKADCLRDEKCRRKLPQIAFTRRCGSAAEYLTSSPSGPTRP